MERLFGLYVPANILIVSQGDERYRDDEYFN